MIREKQRNTGTSDFWIKEVSFEQPYFSFYKMFLSIWLTLLVSEKDLPASVSWEFVALCTFLFWSLSCLFDKRLDLSMKYAQLWDRVVFLTYINGHNSYHASFPSIGFWLHADSFGLFYFTWHCSWLDFGNYMGWQWLNWSQTMQGKSLTHCIHIWPQHALILDWSLLVPCSLWQPRVFCKGRLEKALGTGDYFYCL